MSVLHIRFKNVKLNNEQIATMSSLFTYFKLFKREFQY